MARKSKEDIKKEKEVNWFKRKYVWKEDNFEYFVNQLSPHDVQKIVKLAFKNGMGFNWDDDDLELMSKEKLAQKLSLWDLVKLKKEGGNSSQP